MEFFRPESISDAVGLLSRHEGARCLAGGATLVAMMNAGLVEPSAIVSLDAVSGLAGIERRDDGFVSIGAMTRHAETARSTLFEGGQRVVPAAAGRIANVPVRNMGTMGGSVAFADPAADYLPALVAADAIVKIAGSEGERTVSMREFVVDWYTTTLAPDEIITAFLVPASPGAVGLYEKLDRTSGDFAIASVALVLALDGGRCRTAQIAIGGCGPAPVRSDEAERLLVGTRLEPQEVAAAGQLLAEACDPVDDVRATAAYRRLVVPRLLGKAIARAAAASGASA